jgi:hypothetical protein
MISLKASSLLKLHATTINLAARIEIDCACFS